MSKATDSIREFPRRATAERHQLAEHVRRVHWYTAPTGVTIDDLMTPSYWEILARNFHPLDRIEIVDDAGTYFAELMVLDTSGGLRLTPLRGVDLRHEQLGARDSVPHNATGVQAVYRGPYLRWCAMRGDVALKEKMTEQECRQWIAGHAKAAAK